MKRIELNNIKVSATYTVSSLVSELHRDEAKRISKLELANVIAEQIVSNPAFFYEKTLVEYNEVQYKAHCYVLTEDDFTKLVAKIKQDLQYNIPPMIY